MSGMTPKQKQGFLKQVNQCMRDEGHEEFAYDEADASRMLLWIFPNDFPLPQQKWTWQNINGMGAIAAHVASKTIAKGAKCDAQDIDPNLPNLEEAAVAPVIHIQASSSSAAAAPDPSLPVELSLLVAEKLAEDRDKTGVQAMMQLNRQHRVGVSKLCTAMHTTVEQGMNRFPLHGELRKLTFSGVKSELSSFVGRHGDRLSKLDTLNLRCCDEEDDDVCDLDATILTTVQSVAPNLSNLEVVDYNLDPSFFECFGEGCRVTSLVVDVHDEDDYIRPYLKHLRSIKRLCISSASPMRDDSFRELLSLPRLEHVTILNLRLRERHGSTPCGWKSLTLVHPSGWQTLSSLPSAVGSQGMSLTITDPSSWTYPGRDQFDGPEMEVLAEFERAVMLFLRTSPDLPLPTLMFPTTQANLSIDHVDRLVGLLMPLVQKKKIKLVGLAGLLRSRPQYQTLSRLLNCLEVGLEQPRSSWEALEGHLLAVLESAGSWEDAAPLWSAVASRFRDLVAVVRGTRDWKAANAVLSLVESVVWKPCATALWTSQETDELLAFYESAPDEMVKYVRSIFDVLARRPERLLELVNLLPAKLSVMRAAAGVVGVSLVPLPVGFIQDALQAMFKGSRRCPSFAPYAPYTCYHWVRGGRGADALFHAGGLQLMTHVLNDVSSTEYSRLHAACTIAKYAKSDSMAVLAAVHGDDAVRGVVEFFPRRASLTLPDYKNMISELEEFVASLAPILIQRMWNADSAQRAGAAKVLLDVCRTRAPVDLPPAQAMPPLMAMLQDLTGPDLDVVVDLLSLVDFGEEWCVRVVSSLTALSTFPHASVLSLLAKTFERLGPLSDAAAKGFDRGAFDRLVPLKSENALRIVAKLLRIHGRPWRERFVELDGLDGLIDSDVSQETRASQRILGMFNLRAASEVIELD